MSLSYERVVEAATAIMRTGHNPSASAVIERLGEGSKSTAVKFLRQWRESLETSGYHLPPSIPDALQPSVESFWDAAVQQASETFEAERAALQYVIDERDGQIATMQSAAESLQREVTQSNQALDELRTQTAALTTECDELKEALATSESARESDAQAHADAIASLTEAHDLVLSNEQTAHEATRQRLEEKLDERDVMIQADRDRFQRSEDNWVMELDKTRGQIREMAERLDTEREAWAAERQLLRREADQRAARYAEMEAEKRRLDSVVENLESTLNTEKARWTEAAADMQHQIEAARQDRDEARSETKRLHALLDRALATKSTPDSGNKKAPGDEAQ